MSKKDISKQLSEKLVKLGLPNHYQAVYTRLAAQCAVSSDNPRFATLKSKPSVPSKLAWGCAYEIVNGFLKTYQMIETIYTMQIDLNDRRPPRVGQFLEDETPIEYLDRICMPLEDTALRERACDFYLQLINQEDFDQAAAVAPASGNYSLPSNLYDDSIDLLDEEEEETDDLEDRFA